MIINLIFLSLSNLLMHILNIYIMKMAFSILAYNIAVLYTMNLVCGQNNLDNYLKTPPIQTTIASEAQGVKAPRDIEINPKIANQVWVPNFGTYDRAASMVIISNAGMSNQSIAIKQDEEGKNNHFFNSPSALAFSNNGNLSTVSEIDNSPGDTKNFMGPVLWVSADFAKFTDRSSHIDMLHMSPYAMGVEAEKDNIFWVFDGMNGNICRYNFNNPHPYGEHDHSDGQLQRYSEVNVSRKSGIPSHLVRDRANNWLYIVDGGNKRILRMDISSGIKNADLNCNEQYTNGCYSMKNVKWQTVVSSGLAEPSGIDVKGGKMVVSDHSTGDIVLYSLQSGVPVEAGRVKTQSGIMGVKISDDNKIWYVNNKLNKVVRLDYGLIANNENANDALAFFNVYPNPANSNCNLKYQLATAGQVNISLNTLLGKEIKIIYNGNAPAVEETISMGDMPKGIYIINFSLDGQLLKTQKLIIN